MHRHQSGNLIQLINPQKTDKHDKQQPATTKRDHPDLPTRKHPKTDNPNQPDNTQQSLMDTNTTSSLMTKSLATQQRAEFPRMNN
jgi:heme-binding NEAT domain protein